MKKRFAVVIPAYGPSEQLPQYVRQLADEGVPKIIVINDGSAKEYDPIFKQLFEIPQCILLTHSTNKGKGAALKTGFRHYLKHFNHLAGVVTADADDQHAVSDVLKVGELLHQDGPELVLGIRTFQYGEVPTRSFVGNTITSKVFKWLFKYDIQDTQTGLRGIHTKALHWTTLLRGEKFEYEMNMLINAAKKKMDIQELPIQTIYHENHQSHYQSVSDSMRIIQHLFKGLTSPHPSKEEIKTKERMY